MVYRIIGDFPGSQYFQMLDDGRIIVRYSPMSDIMESRTYTVSDQILHLYFSNCNFHYLW